MKVNTIVFSPTGGTKKAADYLKASFSEQGEEIDFSRQDFSGFTADPDQVYIIAAPVFSGRIPEIAISNLKKIDGKSAKAIVLASFGNRDFDDALLELADVSQEIGFQLIAAIAASTEHSLWRQYGASRPDDRDKLQLGDFAKQIQEKINQGEFDQIQIPGNRPYKEASRSSIRPITYEKKCTECMDCVLACPAAAIPTNNPKLTDDSKCFACMRCIRICPYGARHLSPAVAETGEKMREYLESRKDNHLFL